MTGEADLASSLSPRRDPPAFRFRNSRRDPPPPPPVPLGPDGNMDGADVEDNEVD